MSTVDTSSPMFRPVDGAGRELPLSYPQQLLHFLGQMRPGGVGLGFNVWNAFVLRGHLDKSALGWAVDALTARHDILRTVVSYGPGIPFQRVASISATGLDFVDLTGARDRDRAIGSFLAETESWPFDTSTPPLLQVRVGLLAPDERIVTVITHHSVSDAWSMPILVSDLAALYNHRCHGGPELPVALAQYSDYALAQFAVPDDGGAARAASLAYWGHRLEGCSTTSLRRHDSPGSGSGVDRLVSTFSEEDSALVVAHARSNRCTLFMVLLSGYHVALAHMTGSNDILVPTINAGRNDSNFEKTVGFFLNAMLLRTDLSGDPTLGEIRNRVRATCLEAYRHQNVPILQVVEESPDMAMLLADPSAALLPFQFIQIPDASAGPDFGPGCEMDQLFREDAASFNRAALPTDGQITVRLVRGKISAIIDFSVEAFDEAMISELMTTFVAGVRTLCKEPDLPLSRFATDG